VVLNSAVVVVDANKCKMYSKNFGEFFLNQIEHAGTIILSRTADISESKLNTALEIIREHNSKATVITTPWDELDGVKILETIENAKDLESELMAEVAAMKDEHEHHHHHDEDEHDEHHHHHHHDEDDHDEDEHEHHHHHHDEDEHEHEHHHHDHDDDEHEHHHHHDHDENCTCGCHDHHDHDHHHHHADDIFASWGFETPTAYSQAEIENILSELENEEKYGQILRAKGMVPAGDGTWINFDYVPGESDIRKGSAEVTGKICVIGAELKEDNLKTLFEK
jgi:G3E family GTPase